MVLLLFFLASLAFAAETVSPPTCSDIYTQFNVNGRLFLDPFMVSMSGDGLYINTPDGKEAGKGAQFPDGQKWYLTLDPSNRPGKMELCAEHRDFSREDSEIRCPAVSDFIHADSGRAIYGRYEIDQAKNLVKLVKNIHPRKEQGNFQAGEERVEIRFHYDSTRKENGEYRYRVTAVLQAFGPKGEKLGRIENKMDKSTDEEWVKPPLTRLDLGPGREFVRMADCSPKYQDRNPTPSVISPANGSGSGIAR
jgi:hypothetical protein